MLVGKKTYIVAALMVIFAVIGLYLGKLDGAQSIQLILEAAAISGLRSAISSN